MLQAAVELWQACCAGRRQINTDAAQACLYRISSRSSCRQMSPQVSSMRPNSTGACTSAAVLANLSDIDQCTNRRSLLLASRSVRSHTAYIFKRCIQASLHAIHRSMFTLVLSKKLIKTMTVLYNTWLHPLVHCQRPMEGGGALQHHEQRPCRCSTHIHSRMPARQMCFKHRLSA